MPYVPELIQAHAPLLECSTVGSWSQNLRNSHLDHKTAALAE